MKMKKIVFLRYGADVRAIVVTVNEDEKESPLDIPTIKKGEFVDD